MSENEPKEVRFTLRIPGDVYAEIVRYAKGNGKRPESSINAAIVFLLRMGLRAERHRYGDAESVDDEQTLALVTA